jgi:hypothetical protein
MTSFDLTKLDGVTLSARHGNIGTQRQGCAMDAIAWATTGEITDMPSCVHAILARKVHKINDASHTSEADRWLIVREGGPLLVDSDTWDANRVLHVIARCGMTAAGFVAALAMQPADDLYRANLSWADLSGANLSWADLSEANLSGADLYGADLYRATLSGADLSGAYLSRADLSGAYLYGANLYGANLSGANLSGAKASKYTVFPDGFDHVAAGVVTA